MQPISFVRVEVTGDEPIDLDAAKAQLRVTHTLEDDFIESLISVAREHIEDYCKRSLVKQTWKVGFGPFCKPDRKLELARPPLDEVTSVGYYNVNNEFVVIDSANYIVDTMELRGAIVLKSSFTLPELSKDYINPIVVEFTTGAEESPVYNHAIKLLLTHLNENRSAVVTGVAIELPLGVKSLLASKRILNSL
jgi:uncharacterized phiE125 gp8 family phage protein